MVMKRPPLPSWVLVAFPLLQLLARASGVIFVNFDSNLEYKLQQARRWRYTMPCNIMPKKSLPTTHMDETTDDFESLYKANEPLIYRFMFWRTRDSMLAQDLTSHVFEKAWRTRTHFTGGSAKAWLYKIAHTTLIDYWRKKKEVAIDNEAAADVPSDTVTVDEAIDQSMALADLEQALRRLPQEMHKVVQLRFIEGLSARDAARQLNISEANVRVIQYRALKKLRGYLQ